MSLGFWRRRSGFLLDLVPDELRLGARPGGARGAPAVARRCFPRDNLRARPRPRLPRGARPRGARPRGATCADGAAPVGGGVARACRSPRRVIYRAGRDWRRLARRWCGLCVPSRCSAPSAGTRCCTTTTVAAKPHKKANTAGSEMRIFWWQCVGALSVPAKRAALQVRDVSQRLCTTGASRSTAILHVPACVGAQIILASGRKTPAIA